MTPADHQGALVVDASALQSPTTRLRGIGRYALGWCRAVERAAPGLIGRYLLDPGLPPLPGEAADLVTAGAVRYRDAPDALPERARLVHTFSLLDGVVPLDQCWPEWPGRPPLLRSVTVFDCIPALEPDVQLADPLERRRYVGRFGLLAAADQLQVLARSVAADLGRLLEVPPRRIALVGAAADDRFVPPTSREGARRRAAGAVEGLCRRYVLYPSGSHPRKNNESLVRAWARLPASLLASHQLVLTGALPAAMQLHYHLVADRLGIAGVVLAGDVDEDDYLALLQGAELVCFPSLAEGYGLPVAEALACGTPVVASDRPPLDELLPADRRFDPTAPASIALALVAALAARHAGPEPVARRASWPEVAGRAVAALDELLARPQPVPSPQSAPSPQPAKSWPSPQAAPQPARRAAGGPAGRRGRRARRSRIAVVTPLPPAQSGVAAYSYRLVEELDATGAVEIELFADGPTPGQRGPAGLPVRPTATLHTVESLAGAYDHVLYAVGNSHFHLDALRKLRRRPGVVLAHDVRLTNLYLAEHGDVPIEAQSLPAAVRALYGEGVPDDLGIGNVFAEEQVRRFGLLLAREVIESSVAYLVSSRAARELALSDVPGRFEERVGVLPFALEAPLVSTGAPDTSGASDPPPDGAGSPGDWLAGLGGAPLVAHFGIVDPAKEPGRLLEAFALLARREPTARLAFVGPLAESLAEDLSLRAGELGVAAAVLLSGQVPAPLFRAFIERATVAVQLRSSFNGEASAAVGQCLACGLPTVVSRLGWMAELPADAVVHVPPRVEPAALASTLADLVADPARRGALSVASGQLASRQSFAQTASALLEVLDALGLVAARAV